MVRLNHLEKLQLLILALVVGVTGIPAVAQEAAGVKNELIEEIVVSARKRTESILEVPVAITAFGADDIDALGLEGINDLQLFTPGFSYEAFATIPGRFDSAPRFRGVSVDTLAPLRQTASIFVDGIFVVNAASGISLNDIERVEVIKGPQSAYFGRNTFGGAVNYVTKAPADEFGGSLNASVADRDDYEISGSIEGPLTDWLSGRVSGAYHDDGSHYSNPLGGGGLGDEETWSISGSLYFQPSDRFDAKFRVSYVENDDGVPASISVGLAEHNCGPFGGAANDTLICGDVPIRTNRTTLARNTDSDDLPDLFFTNTEPLNEFGDARSEFGFDRELINTSLAMTFDASESIQLNSLTGYALDQTNLLRDADESGESNFLSVSAREFEMFSQEFRVSGTHVDSRLDWSLGVNFFKQRFETSGNFINPSTGGGFFGNPNVNLNPNLEEIETLGVFGSISYEIIDGLKVSFEARQQNDDVTEDNNINNDGPGSEPLQADFDSFLPRVIVEYAFADTGLVYVSYSEGNLPGGFNSDVQQLIATNPAAFAELLTIEPSVGAEFDEETLEQYEVGVKYGFPDGKGSISAALFFLDRVDQAFRRTVLLAAGGGGTDNYQINAGGSEATGIEIEGSYQILPSINLDASIGYIDSEITSFESGIFNEIFGVLDSEGSETSRYPDLTGSLSLSGNHELSDGYSWFWRADTVYIGERFTDEGNLTTAEDGFIVNLRAGLTAESYKVELFVKNATDSEVPTGLQRSRDLSLGFGGFSTFGYIAGLRDRRQVGARVSYNF